MGLPEIETNKFVKIIEFVLKNNRFSAVEACKKSGMSIPEFNGAKYSLFLLKDEHEISSSEQGELTWNLSPEAYFHYLSFVQYKHAVSTSNRAHWLAICSLVISIIMGVASVISSFT